MNISALSVRRGVTFLMLYLILTGFGFYSLLRLQLDLFPDISFPMVMVLTNYTGASPEDIETVISKPIERSVASVKGVTEINSTSQQGVSAVQVSFDWGEDMDQAETNVRRSVDMIKGLLPDDADAPMIFAFDPSMQPIVIMTVTGPYPLDQLRDIASNDIAPRIERIAGIASAQVSGGLAREIHIVLDPARVQAMGLDVNQVVGSVFRENMQVPGGSIQQGTLDFTIQTIGKYQNVKEIGEVVVGMRQDLSGRFPKSVPIQLKEVAKVEDSYVESQRILTSDGNPSVWMMIRKQSGSNTVRGAEAIMAELDKIKTEGRADVSFGIIFNQANIVNKSLGNLSSTAIMGVGITFLVLLLFLLSIRASLVVSSAIPLSVIATFVVMDMFGITLNILSMAGLALAIGMLVDNAIVVLENIYRLLELGKKSWAASIEGAATVGTAVTASTLTTVSVFVPVLFVPGIAGQLFRDMAITICFSLLVSLLVARTFIPLASSRILGSKKFVRALRKRNENPKGPINALKNFYGRTLDFSLDHRWIVIVATTAALIATAIATPLLPTDFMTQDDQSMVFLQVENSVGTNLEASYQVMEQVRHVIEKTVPERKMIAMDQGIGEGFTAIFSKGVHAAFFRIPLVGVSERQRSQAEIEQALTAALKQQVPGVKFSTQMPFNPMGGTDIEVQIVGYDLKTSRQIGMDLQRRIEPWPEVSSAEFSMEEQKPEIRVHFKRDKMAKIGLSSAQIGNAISTYFQGKLAGRYSEGGDEYNIKVRYGKAHRQDLDELKRMPVVSPTGAVIPLANVAELEQTLGPVGITRLDQDRVTRLNISLRSDYKLDGKKHRKDLGTSVARVEKILQNYKWPKGFSYHIGGAAEDFKTSFKYLGIALMIAILLVYMVMASQFESLRQPFIILFTIPLAGIGVVWMFVLTQTTMNISALVGVIMLIGIVVNNGIVMVDAANQLREAGKDRLTAIAEAARMRMRPVLMTSMTTILAMVPLALGIGEGAETWIGLARAVIGGLVASTLLTLYIVPTAYTFFAAKYFKSLAERMGEKELAEPTKSTSTGLA